MEFDWSEYLENIKGVAVPEELFTHVEASLDNGIKQGMLLEVCHKSNPDVYWIAEITMVCGHLLRIKFIGAAEDFWCDISSSKVHPLGWCGKYDELIEPPDDINEKYGDKLIDMMKNALVGGRSVSIEALNNKGLSPIDRIKVGMKTEVQSQLDVYKYWIATVCENVGGRLLLRYDGADEEQPPLWSFFCNPRIAHFGYVTNKVCENVGGRLLLRYDGADEEQPPLWSFFCNPRIAHFGYVTNKGSPWQFKYPGKVNKFSCKVKLSTQLRQSAEEAIKEPTPADLFQPNQNLESHNFVTGMKLEAINPVDMKTFHAATVTKVFNNFHFLVVIDDHHDDYEETKMAWLCDSKHPYIYPIGWTQKNNLQIKTPNIWKEENFDWDEYLTMTSSVPAPEYCFGEKVIKDMKPGMKLEAVNPLNHEEIHVASIESVIEHMVLVKLIPIGEKFWFSQDSDLLYPAGWCDSNHYELHVPDLKTQKEALEKEQKENNKEDKIKKEEWCEALYFNYKCYAGPWLSRSKLAQLPQSVGPGPLALVLRDVLNRIISASYKPAKLLKDWETSGPPEEGMRLEMLRAKLKTSTYHAYVPVATSVSAVPEFCRSVCKQLHACPSLFGPRAYTGPAACPHHCQLVDKSTFHNFTERRGRPKGSRKRRRGPEKREKEEKEEKDEKETEIQPSQESETNDNRDERESAESEHSGSSPPNTRPTSPRIRAKRGTKNNQPKLEMKTRGAKLPNFAQQIKESHWTKKDVETIYNNTCVKKRTDSESENETSSNSRDAKNISDVSDSEEPELKKLKFNSYDPLPSDNKQFEKSTTLSLLKNKLKLSPNPLEWSVDDVFSYLTNTDDCKLIAERMKQEEIDGQALIMLDLETIKHFLHMKNEYAMHLCKHITMIRYYYVDNFES